MFREDDACHNSATEGSRTDGQNDEKVAEKFLSFVTEFANHMLRLAEREIGMWFARCSTY